MNVNGEAIHGTTPGPFPQAPPWGRVTQKPGKLYLHVFAWPKDGKLVVPGLTAKVTNSYLLADAKRAALTTTADAGGVDVAVPAQAPTRLLRWSCWRSKSNRKSGPQTDRYLTR